MRGRGLARCRGGSVALWPSRGLAGSSGIPPWHDASGAGRTARAVLEDTEAALRKSAGWYADLAGQVLVASVLR